jgi:hypothetical protein
MRPKPPRARDVVVGPSAARRPASRPGAPDGRDAGFEAGDPRHLQLRVASEDYSVLPTQNSAAASWSIRRSRARAIAPTDLAPAVLVPAPVPPGTGEKPCARDNGHTVRRRGSGPRRVPVGRSAGTDHPLPVSSGLARPLARAVWFHSGLTIQSPSPKGGRRCHTVFFSYFVASCRRRGCLDGVRPDTPVVMLLVTVWGSDNWIYVRSF